MKLSTKLAPITLLCLASLSAHAEATENAKPFNIGISYTSLGMSTDAIEEYYGSTSYSDNFSGLGLFGSYTFTDNFFVTGNYYSLDHEDTSSVNDQGLEFIFYGGAGLTTTNSAKLYAGLGYYSGTFSVSSYEKDVSGLILSGGIGYNWEQFAVDFVIGFRDSNGYEDALIETYDLIGYTITDADISSTTVDLKASFRF